MVSCDVCNLTFPTTAAAVQHKRAPNHCICPICYRTLASTSGLAQHTAAVHHPTCPRCDACFVDATQLRKHQRAAGRCHCGDRNRVPPSDKAPQKHHKSSAHATEFRCCDCDRSFASGNALDQHLRDAKYPPAGRDQSPAPM